MDIFFYTIILAVSLSLDSFGIGASYGIKKIKIPIFSLLIMSVLTFLFTFLSLTFGKILNAYLSELFIRIFSLFLLVSLAISMLLPSKKRPDNPNKTSKRKRIFSLFVSCIGITVTVIKTPLKGDKNNSKIIEFKEALCIGAALSLDSFCACLGLSGENFGILLPLFISAFQFIFMYIGEKVGKFTTQISNFCEKIFSYISPLILLIIAILQFTQML